MKKKDERVIVKPFSTHYIKLVNLNLIYQKLPATYLVNLSSQLKLILNCSFFDKNKMETPFETLNLRTPFFLYTVSIFIKSNRFDCIT